MKKGSKPFLFFTFFFCLVIAAIVLVYVGLRKECDSMTRERYETEKLLEGAKNSNINLIAQLQFLSSEERITNLAVTRLGMIKQTSQPITISVDRDKIEDVKEELGDKYGK